MVVSSLFGSMAGADETDQERTLLIDDFSRDDGRSALGSEWRAFTDQVMGGVSRGRAARDTLDRRPCVRLRGEVSLANNGGFIQVALPLAPPSESIDASAYSGVRLSVRGNGETYYVHLRSGDTRFPWQYYQASFPTSEAWTDIDIPFTAFAPENLRAPLDRGRLARLGIVAARKAMNADVAVARVAFYR
jgi:hypothetical protein